MPIRVASMGLIGSVVAGLAVALLAPPASAQAAASSGSPPAISSTTLPITGFEAMVADTGHRHLFITGGYSDPSLLVTDFSGNVVGTIPVGSRASSLALSADRRTLFVALPTADTIAVVDTATLKETARYSTGVGTSPTHVAASGHDAWFGYGQPGNAGIGLLDRHHGTVTLTPEPDFYAAPDVVTSPATPGILLVGEVTVTPSIIEEFNVASGSPVLTAATQPGLSVDDCQNLQGLAITADGRDVVATCGWPYYALSYSLTGLVKDGTYQTGPYTDRVAIAKSGEIAVGVNPSSTANLFLFSPGNSTPTASYALGGASSVYETVYGLAWGSHDRELFVMVYDLLLQRPVLYTINFDTH